MVVRWQFYDPTVPETYTLDINPSSGGVPQYEKNITTAITTAPAPDGKAILFEGAQVAQTFAFSGTILTQAHRDALVSWFNKRHQIRVTDHLGEQFWIYITSLELERKRSVSHDYYYEYTMNATILDVA